MQQQQHEERDSEEGFVPPTTIFYAAQLDRNVNGNVKQYQ